MWTMQVVSGILASVDGDKLVTDKSWKCTTQLVNGWTSIVFDDNSWSDAVIAGTNTASDIHGNLPQIHSSASWIWTANHKDPSIDKTVYCRGYLSEYEVQFITISTYTSTDFHMSRTIPLCGKGYLANRHWELHYNGIASLHWDACSLFCGKQFADCSHSFQFSVGFNILIVCCRIHKAWKVNNVRRNCCGVTATPAA